MSSEQDKRVSKEFLACVERGDAYGILDIQITPPFESYRPDGCVPVVDGRWSNPVHMVYEILEDDDDNGHSREVKADMIRALTKHVLDRAYIDFDVDPFHQCYEALKRIKNEEQAYLFVHVYLDGLLHCAANVGWDAERMLKRMTRILDQLPDSELGNTHIYMALNPEVLSAL